jgi:hypothetical protein
MQITERIASLQRNMDNHSTNTPSRSERSLFSLERRNWPDLRQRFRSSATHDQQTGQEESKDLARPGPRFSAFVRY